MTTSSPAGLLRWHFTMSLDGFVAGPDHAMDGLVGASLRPGLFEQYVASTGAVLGGRAGLDAYPDVSNLFGGAWQGPVFVLTHHPDDLAPVPGVTVLSCDVAEAARTALAAAGGKDVEVLSASIGAQLLDRGLLDEIHLHVAPVLLGDGIRLYGPGARPVPLERLDGDPALTVDLVYRPARRV